MLFFKLTVDLNGFSFPDKLLTSNHFQSWGVGTYWVRLECEIKCLRGQPFFLVDVSGACHTSASDPTWQSELTQQSVKNKSQVFAGCVKDDNLNLKSVDWLCFSSLDFAHRKLWSMKMRIKSWKPQAVVLVDLLVYTCPRPLSGNVTVAGLLFPNQDHSSPCLMYLIVLYTIFNLWPVLKICCVFEYAV